MSDLLIELLKLFKDEQLKFTLKKGELKPEIYCQIIAEFENNWKVSVVDDEGVFEVATIFEEHTFYYSYKASEINNVKEMILEVSKY